MMHNMCLAADVHGQRLERSPAGLADARLRLVVLTNSGAEAGRSTFEAVRSIVSMAGTAR